MSYDLAQRHLLKKEIYDYLLDGWTGKMITNKVIETHPELNLTKKYISNIIYEVRDEIKKDIEKHKEYSLTDCLNRLEALYEKALLNKEHKLALNIVKSIAELLQLYKKDNQLDIKLKQEWNGDIVEKSEASCKTTRSSKIIE